MRVGIFGLGYTGIRIAKRLKLQAEIRLETFSAKTRVEGTEVFDFSNPFALKEFGEKFSREDFDLCVVTFPVQKLFDPISFINLLFSVGKRCILLGTTSIYKRVPDIVESTPLIEDHDRFAIENEWIGRSGKILRLCGIYGPLRNPGDWARKGLVKKCSKQLNLIHGDDVALTISLLIRKIRTTGWDTLPNVLNLSDNQWHTWKEIFSFLEEHEKISKTQVEESPKEDSFVDSGLIRSLLPDLQTKNFWMELEGLEGIGD
ncbi:hypothetical protein IQB76_12645 [Leptospira borgpetersenii serovar Hardjo-bovis]|uniref:Uncharacterized protein n=1 Tax=Leptospira borgpetersenii serovar Hardjo-bovis str. Sponselee TaxID=1303729 RepID=M6BMT4_LEPBO|nr:hypothetical protein [Leptospira borgpetersenii]ABJ79639.1 Conserved hypothetical protein [Leptospira borgpetersenii serovar Hardjo-bovis str. L550]AMX58998.1 hypothetical protein LBK6_11820 [Leptospira borgpetersenii serovar Hardjo]AMX62250.1 hypothetical protein LBK9_11860 [Leptospira borgpetersenii serovar Hardjo]AMX65493.1 hypothetical protein LBK30_11880 [Leptospira borgpetersenii serovar Hardjo]AMX68703.1 hypothetical protein LBHA_11710 [Leptospira borgpetersenii serovar Hardjo]